MLHSNSYANNTLTDRLKRWTATRLLSFTLAGALLAGSNLVAAQVLVFDRGLPTANLNNAAAANKSNVLWADQETQPITPYLPGDDFTLPGTGPYVVNKIRVWSLENTGLTLQGGVATGPIAQISNTFTATAVTYANSQSYQNSAGAFLMLYQIDFTVNIPLNGGVAYQFFLGGTPIAAGNTDFIGPRLHASNAALSGSTQQGANGTFLFLANDGTAQTWNSMTGAGTYCPVACPGWDKVSDGNVQVFAAPTPAAPVVQVPAVSGSGLAGLALLLAGAAFYVARNRRRTASR